MTRPPHRSTAPSGPPRAGFTLVELLVVFVVLAILIALLLPAINGAVRTAKNTAAQANITQLGQALAAFKSRYGEYPPSRVILWEDGWFRITNDPMAPASPALQSDITVGQLAQRSLSAMKKYFPKVNLSSSAPVWVAPTTQWYDFNGDGKFGGIDPTSGNPDPTRPIVLQGHQCLVFFLGGLPQVTDEGYTMTGFAKNPENPFTPSIAPTAPINAPTFFSQNREAPLFEFAADRLKADPNNAFSGVPGYFDSLGNTLVPDSQMNFILYFSSYGNNAYDPNDVNFAYETDDAIPQVKPIIGYFSVRHPVRTAAIATSTRLAASPAPNPYTSTPTLSGGSTAVSFVNPQTYQLISPGMDGLYGIGGQFKPDNTAGVLPFIPAGTPPPAVPNTNSADATVRQRERDNLTNFHGGRLD